MTSQNLKILTIQMLSEAKLEINYSLMQLN